MFGKRRIHTAKWSLILVVVLVAASTALAAAQSPELHLPLVSGGAATAQEAPIAPVEEVQPVEEQVLPVEEEEPLPAQPEPEAPAADSRDTQSGDHDTEMVADEVGMAAAYDATQWTVEKKVGIGTMTPTEPLDIFSNANGMLRSTMRNPNTGDSAEAQFYLNTGSSNGLVTQQFGTGYTATWNGVSLTNMARLRTTPSVNGLILTTGGSAPLILGTADSEKMRIQSGGQVGIFTRSPDPAFRLTVTVAGGFCNFVACSPVRNGIKVVSPLDFGILIADSQGTGMFVGNPVDNGVAVFSPGNHGVAVLCPCGGDGVSVKDGDIRVTNGSFIDTGTTLNVPDYVFEPGYTLMSLDELRNYVAKEKHLPNIPDMDQIHSSGLDLSDFQMRLLEKTEELTLYVLAQDEQLQTQQQQMEGLQQDNLDLQKTIVLLQQQNVRLDTRLTALEQQK